MLVTKKAPDFTAKAVLADGQIVENFNLYENIGEKGAVLFFYPLDFTFVCPSEIIAFSKRIEDFTSRGISVIGCSVDSQFSHFAWRETPVEQGGIGRVKFPLVADLSKSISRDYDVLFTNEHGEVCPAGWVKGDEGMKSNTAGVAEYLAKNEGKL